MIYDFFQSTTIAIHEGRGVIYTYLLKQKLTLYFLHQIHVHIEVASIHYSYSFMPHSNLIMTSIEIKAAVKESLLFSLNFAKIHVVQQFLF